MTTKLSLIIESDIKPQKERELKNIVHELCDFVERTEPGTLRYDWFIRSNSQSVILLEEYASIEAAMFHGSNYAPYREALDAVRIVKRRVICSAVDDATKGRLKSMAPEFYEPFKLSSAKSSGSPEGKAE